MTQQPSSFQPYTETAKLRTIMQISGEVGSGKTRFALTAPGPMFYQSFDKGLEGTVDQLREAGLLPAEFYVADYDWHPGGEEFTQDMARELRQRFIDDYLYALDNGARSVVWDKESDIWELFRVAEFGPPANGQLKDYVKLNQRYKTLINKVKPTDANLIMIQAMGGVWESYTEGGKRKFRKTQERERRGFDTLDEIVLAETHFLRQRNEETGGAEFLIQVGKCRQNTALQNQTFQGMTFSEFGQLLVPGSAEGDWR